MKQLRLPFIALLTASALLTLAAPVFAQVDVGVTLGYPGGYGIAQPSYVAPQSIYAQPPSVYMQRDWRDGRRQWQDQHAWHEQEWEHRHRHGATHWNDNNGWNHSQQDDRSWRNGQSEHERHDGRRR